MGSEEHQLMFDLPDGYADALICDTRMHFTWMDRLRILVRGEAWLYTKTATEHEPGNTRCIKSQVTVPRVLPQRKQRGGIAWIEDDHHG